MLDAYQNKTLQHACKSKPAMITAAQAWMLHHLTVTYTNKVLHLVFFSGLMRKFCIVLNDVFS